MYIYYVLGWLKSSFGFFCKILWKIPFFFPEKFDPTLWPTPYKINKLLGWPKSLIKFFRKKKMGFSIISYRKTQTNFSANPIHSKCTLYTILCWVLWSTWTMQFGTYYYPAVYLCYLVVNSYDIRNVWT